MVRQVVLVRSRTGDPPAVTGSMAESDSLAQCCELIAALKERAKALASNIPGPEDIGTATSQMMVDMLTLKRLNRELFEAVTAGSARLCELKVGCDWTVVHGRLSAVLAARALVSFSGR